MTPPLELDVTTPRSTPGFTARVPTITSLRGSDGGWYRGTIRVADALASDNPAGKLGEYMNSLWRPIGLLRKGTMGTRVAYSENSFYQNDNNVTVAYYKVPGYRYLAMAWFSNADGHRIA